MYEMCRRLSNTFHTRVNSSTASMHALRHLPQLTIPPNSNYWYAKSVFVGCRMKALGSACISLAATAMHPLHLGHRQGSNASSKAKTVQREQWVFMLMSPPLEPWQLWVGKIWLFLTAAVAQTFNIRSSAINLQTGFPYICPATAKSCRL